MKTTLLELDNIPLYTLHDLAKFHCCCFLQVLFSLILATEPVIHTVLQDTTIQPQKVYGYQILVMISLFLAWSGSIKLLFLERNRALPTIPTRGHGLVLLMLWSLGLIKEHLPFISWWSNRYWWKLKE